MSQGIKTLSNELIYKKLAPEKPDETYLRGDTPKGILVEKVDLVKEGPNKGKIEQITTIRSSDATIFDDGQSRDPETIIARGPGILEVRPARTSRSCGGPSGATSSSCRTRSPPTSSSGNGSP